MKHSACSDGRAVWPARHRKPIYVALVALLTLFLLLDYLPEAAALSAWVSPPVALFLGLLFALTCGEACPTFNRPASKLLLQYSVVGLGFGMNLHASLQSGREGMAFTVFSVVRDDARRVVDRPQAAAYGSRHFVSHQLGYGHLRRQRHRNGRPRDEGRRFAALRLAGDRLHPQCDRTLRLPVVGRRLGLSQQQFGLWAAIAIHDTSSVVGAGAAYGEEALAVATTVKLTRALWIIPLALVTSLLFKGSGRRVMIPWFILFFVLAMMANTYLLSASETGLAIGAAINGVARKALTLTLFFIGASLSTEVLKSVGLNPLLQGVLLWIAVSLCSLLYIRGL